MLSNADTWPSQPLPRTIAEIFGEPWKQMAWSKHRPFHSYTKETCYPGRHHPGRAQALTPVNSYYKLVKKMSDPEFDTVRLKEIWKYVESNDHAIRLKAESGPSISTRRSIQ